MPSDQRLATAIEIARIGAGRDGYRTYPGTGGIWAGSNQNTPDASFVDWGLARATVEILNAVLDGRLVETGPNLEENAAMSLREELDRERQRAAELQSALESEVTDHNRDREKIAREIEAMCSPESGSDYGLASDGERAAIREKNRIIRSVAAHVRSNPKSQEH